MIFFWNGWILVCPMLCTETNFEHYPQQKKNTFGTKTIDRGDWAKCTNLEYTLELDLFSPESSDMCFFSCLFICAFAQLCLAEVSQFWESQREAAVCWSPAPKRASWGGLEGSGVKVGVCRWLLLPQLNCLLAPDMRSPIWVHLSLP